jgi:hypothetical protein
VTPLSANERSALSILAEQERVEPADCARLAGMGVGLAEAALRSLTNKGLAHANVVRKGLSRRPDGTWSISPAGRDQLADA